MSTTTGSASVADSLRDARVALRTAWYDAALEFLTGCEDWPTEFAEQAIVLKAETLSRRDPLEAIGYLTTVEDIPESAAGRFAFALAIGREHAAVRDYHAAASRYAEARLLVDAVPNGAATLAFHDLRMRAYRRDLSALTAPETLLALAHPDPTLAASSYNFRGWLHAFAGDYAAHMADMRQAVSYALTSGSEPVDVQVIALSLHTLAQAAFETADEDAMSYAMLAFESVAWTPDIRDAHYLTVRVSGWDAFMRGQPGRAQWAFKDARALAPTDPWRVMAHLDRAFVARVSGNEVWAIEELAEADRIARDVRWESCVEEQRQVLVILATLHASVDVVRAQRYASMYTQLGMTSLHPRVATEGDRRAVARARLAQGLIDQTLGRREAAIAALLEAYAIFDEANFHYRASQAATALAELTGEPVWRDNMLMHARRYPDCPLAAAGADVLEREDAMPQVLSPLQRQIARAIWTGADPEELSRRFSRSLFTIDRQAAAVYAAFGVENRTELLLEARRRKLA
jgi:DNA-binding NarL/FixJ family response regulator